MSTLDRLVLVQKTHNVSERLHPSDPSYKQWIFRYTFLELEKDLGQQGDITTDALFAEPREIDAYVVSRSEGTVAGIQEVSYFLIGSDPAFKPRLGRFMVDFFKRDGDHIIPGDPLMHIHGDVRDILKVERVILNLLQRMSGIATRTHMYTDRLTRLSCDILITPTRKTLWGMLDRRAVVVGGGGTHRIDLSDAALIKDTHMTLFDHRIPELLKLCTNNPGRFLEIEVESKDDALRAAEAFHQLHCPGGLSVPGVIMFDNMRPSLIKDSISAIREAPFFDDQVLFEASGGVRLDNLDFYARTGVDVISIGELTHSAASLDFSLELAL